MMKYVLYGNGSCGNHGCEAIVRGTHALLGGDLLIQSENPQEDINYGLDEIVRIQEAKTGERPLIPFAKAYIKHRMTGDYFDMDGVAYLPSIQKARGQAQVALSVGGDNYCYGGTGLYAYLNRQYHRNGMKTVLWGCSINPEVTKDRSVAEDLRRYDLLVARESITYESLEQVTDHVMMAPDPAFFMKASETVLPGVFSRGPVVGINVSPMVISYESSRGSVLQSYKDLIRFIIEETDNGVALIPHVVWKSNDDRSVLELLYDEFRESGRVVSVPDGTAPELKYIISKCCCFVGARTHATIAAYSEGVPTLSVGYSVKARGIARDLFGSEENYSIPVQELAAPGLLRETFKKIYSSKDEIRAHLLEGRKQYLSTAPAAVSKLEQLRQA